MDNKVAMARSLNHSHSSLGWDNVTDGNITVIYRFRTRLLVHIFVGNTAVWVRKRREGTDQKQLLLINVSSTLFTRPPRQWIGKSMQRTDLVLLICMRVSIYFWSNNLICNTIWFDNSVRSDHGCVTQQVCKAVGRRSSNSGYRPLSSSEFYMRRFNFLW